MWFVFPQLAGLGSSPTAMVYAVAGLDEARAYLAHPVLGPRLREAARTLAALPGRHPVLVLGSIDAVKLRSSMTLFALADPATTVFQEVLDRYFAGEADDVTLRPLRGVRDRARRRRPRGQVTAGSPTWSRARPSCGCGDPPDLAQPRQRALQLRHAGHPHLDQEALVAGDEPAVLDLLQPLSAAVTASWSEVSDRCTPTSAATDRPSAAGSTAAW